MFYSRIDVLLESVTNLRTLAWLLLGAINHVIDDASSQKFIHVMNFTDNCHLIEYIKVLLQSLARQAIVSRLCFVSSSLTGLIRTSIKGYSAECY